MHDITVLKVITKLLLPFMIMFGSYILLHGEISPGGGFQAGVIFAGAFILYSLVNGLSELQKIIPLFALRLIAVFGVLLYASVGIIAMLMGGRFLGYSVLQENPVSGQMLGIMLVEIGVCCAVFAVIMLIFYAFGGRSASDA